MLDRGLFEANGPDKCGMSFYPLDKPIGSEFPYINGIDVPCHLVPQANRLTLKSLTFSIDPNVAGLLNGVSINAGTYRVDIGGVQMLEHRYHDYPMPGVAGGDGVVSPWDCRRQNPSIGEGVICPASTQFLVRCTPASAGPEVWTTTVTGRRGSTVDIKSTRVVTSLTTANQTLLDYTPAADWTILSITVNVDNIGQVRGQGRICIAGIQVMELPYLGQNVDAPTFGDNRSYAGTLGALSIPLWGIQIGESSRIGFEADSFTDDGARWTMMVSGLEESLQPTPAELAQAIWEHDPRALTA